MATSRWWHQRGLLQRCIADQASGELARMRRSSAGLPPLPWAESLRLDHEPGADSLELLNLATALAEFIHLHRTGIEDALLVRRTLSDWVSIAQAGLEQYSNALTFRTSGSSGAPKSCEHALDTLEQEAAELAEMFGGTRRILFAVPSHHIYGFLFTILLPQALGLREEDVLDLRGSSPARLAGQALPGDLIVGHPDYWQAVGRSVPALPQAARGVTSTAPCPQSVSESIEQTGLGALFHVYGSSETAGIGWRASFREAYQLFSFWRVDAGSADRLLRSMADGKQQSFSLQDNVEWLDERRFRVAARRDAAVQVGGVNVFPAQVRDVLRQHPHVADAAVRLMRPEEGARLKAFIVPGPGIADLARLESELRIWIAANLPAAQRPQALRFGASLPLADNGKAADWDVDVESAQGGKVSMP